MAGRSSVIAIFRGDIMNYTFDEIKKEIIHSFVADGEKKIEGMIYYDTSLKSFLWCKDLHSAVILMKIGRIDNISYFKITKRDGLITE